MTEFGESTITDLPRTTADSLAFGDPRVLGWLKEAVVEGDRINRTDPNYDRIETMMDYVAGQQRQLADAKLKYLPQIVINESRKAMQAHVSALTDLKPTFGFKSSNPVFESHGHLLNKRTVAWWISTMADLELGECIKYALAAGTGDLVVEWDPHAPMGGDNSIAARDPRDTLAIRPSNARSIQLWQGLTLREEHSVNALKGLFPSQAYLFKPSSDSILSRVMGRFRTIAAKLLTPADTLAGLEASAAAASQKPRSGAVVLYRTYLTDWTKNLTAKPIPMGEPGSSWAYLVQPGEYLYPRKRLLVWTDEGILKDGPSQYWHGLFPTSRLKLWSLPWHFLGASLLHDVLPIQDALNDQANDIRLALKKWVDPDTIYNTGAVSDTLMAVLDPRKPGKKIKLNPTYGEGYRQMEGPNPITITGGIQFYDRLLTQFRDLTGTANLQVLQQLRQMPSADTIQKYYEAMTPELRQEGRMVEVFLRDVAEMVKVNWFQFESQAKRITILGDAGLTLEDFDYDPGNLIPALMPGDPGYTPELNPMLHTKEERAQFFHKLFVFMVPANSILAMNAQEQKMLRFQLARMGYYDFWSLMADMEVPNIGEPPAIPLPPLRPPTPEDMQAALMEVAQGLPPRYVPDPMTGQLLEIRVPQTVTERLMAQQLLGIGMTSNPSGRKASGQQAPKMETKSDGRQTVTESAK